MQHHQVLGSSGAASSSSDSLDTSTHLLELPDAALADVLRRMRGLDWQDLLTARRACRRLHTAAAAALDSIHLDDAKQQDVDSLLLYLLRRDQHVTSLVVWGDRSGNLVRLHCLPASCSSLRELSLEWADVRLDVGGGVIGVLHGATALTSLYMYDVSLRDTADSMAAAVARVPTLQHLHLVDTSVAGGGTAPGSMLRPLTGLTSLRLHSSFLFYFCLGDSTLEHLSNLGSLRELELCGSDAQSLAVMQHLSQLTSLKLSGLEGTLISLPGLGRLSALRELEIHSDNGAMDPQSLAGCSQLRRVQLDCTSTAGGPDGVAALLGHLQACTQLTHLDMLEALSSHAPSPAAYAGLTASSSLKRLMLTDASSSDGSAVPIGAWQPMFRGRLLPHLRNLSLLLEADTPARAGEEAAHVAGLTPADMQAMVRCCPGLEYLLVIGSTRLADVGLVPLTALTELRRLHVESDRLSAAVANKSLLHLEGWDARKPSVVAQLQERLAAAGVAAGAAGGGLAQQQAQQV